MPSGAIPETAEAPAAALDAPARASVTALERAAPLLLALTLVLAVALRTALVVRGGIYYWGDEAFRYARARALVDSLDAGNLLGTVDLLLEMHDHTGFAAETAVVALVYRAITRILGVWTGAYPWMPAYLLSFGSVACIGLTYAVARKVGAARGESLLATVLMASSTTMLYFARHVTPYDTAMALALLALWLGLDARTSFRRSLLVGLVLCGAFLVYNGYLTTVATVGTLHVVGAARARGTGRERRGELVRDVTVRALALACAFLLVLSGLTLLSASRGAPPYVPALLKWLDSATQGDFAEGWTIVWEYLWHAEHGLLLLWAAGAGAVLWLGAMRREPPAQTRGLLWLAAVGLIYVALGVNSAVLHKSVVYGRLARQVVPFLCLTTACAVAHLGRGRRIGRPAVAVATAALVAQVAFNFAPPFAQRFPADVYEEVVRRFGPVTITLTVLRGGERPEYAASQPSRYVLLNPDHLFPVRGIIRPPAGTVVYRTPHPLQYLPYQYEGYRPAERARLRSADISMRVIDTGTSPAVP